MFSIFKRRDKFEVNEFKFEIEQRLKEAAFSPDLLHLIKHEWQLFFIMDGFQKNHPKHELINRQSMFLCNAESIQPFVVWKKDLGEESYPIPMTSPEYGHVPRWRNPRKGDAGSVRGEIHALRPSTAIPILDKEHLNTVQFIRKRVNFMVDYRYRSFSRREGWHISEPQRAFVEAWMYVGIREYWDQFPLSEFKMVRMYYPNNPKNPPYYRFTKSEYDVF